jgi:hypothetical protein
MNETYKFRREDTGEVVEVDYATMIQHSHGWITLPDGVTAKRVREDAPRTVRTKIVTMGSRPIVSWNMGFGQHMLDHFEADRVAHGYSDVEFVRDPDVPQYFNVKCESRDAFNRYAKHRNLVNKSGIGGVRLSAEELARAEEMMKERHPVTLSSDS